VKDYGDKDNEDLAKRYGVNKDDYPVVKLFVQGKDPITFVAKDDNQFTADNLKRFIRYILILIFLVNKYETKVVCTLYIVLIFGF
jgi:hypothetical protein